MSQAGCARTRGLGKKENRMIGTFMLGVAMSTAVLYVCLRGVLDVGRGVQKAVLLRRMFIAAPIPNPTMRCGCLSGLPAAFRVTGHRDSEDFLCIQCARSELTRWMLGIASLNRQEQQKFAGDVVAVSGK
jgi:hypothetical protein